MNYGQGQLTGFHLFAKYSSPTSKVAASCGEYDFPPHTKSSSLVTLYKGIIKILLLSGSADQISVFEARVATQHPLESKRCCRVTGPPPLAFSKNKADYPAKSVKSLTRRRFVQCLSVLSPVSRLKSHGHATKGLSRSSLQINLPTAFWGLLGPHKDVNVNFTKTVGKQTTIFQSF